MHFTFSDVDMFSDNSYIMLLVFYAVLFSGAPRGYRLLAKGIGINTKLYPKHYIKTKPCERRLFKIENKTIPKFIYYCVWWLILIGITGFVVTLVFTALCKGQMVKSAEGIAVCNTIYAWFSFVSVAMVFANVVTFAIFDVVFTIRAKNNRRNRGRKNHKFQKPFYLTKGWYYETDKYFENLALLRNNSVVRCSCECFAGVFAHK